MQTIKERTPKVTVILPSLNVSSYIRECVESVIAQTLEDIEIICVDAGSDDGTAEIINEYAMKDKRIVFLHSPQRSYGYQVNMALKKAHGEYIAIVDTDDYIKPNMYRDLSAYADQFNLDYVKSDTWVLIEINNVPRIRRNDLIQDNYLKYEEVFNITDYPGVFMRPANIWDALYRRSFLEENHILFNESKGAAFQDIGFSVQLFTCAARIMYVNEAYYVYREGRPGASCISPNVLQFIQQEFDRCIKNQYVLPDTQAWKYLHGMMARAFIIHMRFLLNSGIDPRIIENDDSYKWLEKKIHDAIDDKIVTSEMFFERDLWTDLSNLLVDYRHFSSEILCRNIEDNEKKQRVLKIVSCGPVCIFGCGVRGMQALDFFHTHDVKVSAMSDNDATIWGSKFFGEIVLDPKECTESYCNQYFIVANKMHYKEIEMQLSKLGIPDSKIIVW